MAYLTTDMSDLLTTEHLEALNNANIWTVNDLISMDIIDIKNATNVKYHMLKDVCDKVKKRYKLPCDDLDFLLSKITKEYKMFPTGLPELTLALDGGFQTQEIIEFCGDCECGKTEMCYLLCGEILSHYDDYEILFIVSNFDLEHEKIIKYIKLKAGGRELDDDAIFDSLSRIKVARLTKLADLVHLLNTIVHGDKKNKIKCIIIDSLSFIVQDDILEIKSSNLNDVNELKRFCYLRASSINRDGGETLESKRNYLVDIYLHEVMRLLTNIAINKNVVVVFTNSYQNLTYTKAWSNAIDHSLHFTKMDELSRYTLSNPRSTVLELTILKTIHNISRIGYSIPFEINDEGLFAIRLTTKTDPEQASPET